MVRRRARLLAVLVATVGLPGCDTLILDREPEGVHLEINSPDNVSDVVLVTSRVFVEVVDPECPTAGCNTIIQLVDADTNVVSLPFAQSYVFNSRLQFFAETYPEALVPATLSMKVFLDDKEWYNDSRLLVTENADGERETLRFVYRYRNLTATGG
jgi:hypothetical protein